MIVIIAVLVPAPNYPEVNEPGDVGKVFETNAFLKNQSAIYIVPDNAETKGFIDKVKEHAVFKVCLSAFYRA